MIIFKDLIGESHDELLSDSYEPKEVFDGVAIEADCSMINIGGESFDTGANASAEEADEGADDQVQKVNNIVHSFRLQEAPYLKGDKKEYQRRLRDYMKALLKKKQEQGKSEEEIEEWQTKAKAFAMHTIKNYKDFDVYYGEHEDEKGMPILLNYREDGVTPYVTLWKDGILEEKV